MKTQLTMFALVVSLFSGCGGEMTLYVGHLTSKTLRGTSTESSLAVSVYEDSRSPGLTITGIGPDPLYFTRKGGLLTLDPLMSDSTYDAKSYQDSRDYQSGSGEMKGVYLSLEVSGRDSMKTESETTNIDFTWSYSGYIN